MENTKENFHYLYALAARRRKEAAKRKRITAHNWTFRQESYLIAAVENRPPLWDASVAEHKLIQVKRELWREVALELKIDGVDFQESRNKWNNLRSNFKAFLLKQRTKKPGKKFVDPIADIRYPHFAELLFLESSNVEHLMYEQHTEHSPKSNSPVHLDNDTRKDEWYPDDLSEVAASSLEARSITLSPIPISAQPSRKPTSSNLSQTTFELLQSLQDMTKSVRPHDHFSSFGEFIADRLRALKPDQAIKVERAITLAMYNCLESFEESPPTPTLTSKEEQIDTRTNPLRSPSPSVPHIIGPKRFQRMGLPNSQRVVVNLPRMATKHTAKKRDRC